MRPIPTFPLLTNIRRALLCCALLTLPAIAQPNTPFVYSVGNSANYNPTIAQGSLIVVFGMNIGPAQLVQASSLPLPLQVGGTAITVTSGSTMLSCPMVYASAGQAAAVLPSNVPPGQAKLNLTYNGQSNPFPTTVNVGSSGSASIHWAARDWGLE